MAGAQGSWAQGAGPSGLDPMALDSLQASGGAWGDVNAGGRASSEPSAPPRPPLAAQGMFTQVPGMQQPAASGADPLLGQFGAWPGAGLPLPPLPAFGGPAPAAANLFSSIALPEAGLAAGGAGGDTGGGSDSSGGGRTSGGKKTAADRAAAVQEKNRRAQKRFRERQVRCCRAGASAAGQPARRCLPGHTPATHLSSAASTKCCRLHAALPIITERRRPR